jgi:hypothetical protein
MNRSTLFFTCIHAFAFAVLRSELTFRPFLLACAAKSTKLTIISLNALQKLLALDAASAEILSSVIGTLRIQAECEDEAIQVKILQTLLLAVGSAPAMARMEENALSQALGLCFRLHGGAGRSPMITNTATATLRQVRVCAFGRDCVEYYLICARIYRSFVRSSVSFSPMTRFVCDLLIVRAHQSPGGHSAL